jgi:hypothetical protein
MKPASRTSSGRATIINAAATELDCQAPLRWSAARAAK